MSINTSEMNKCLISIHYPGVVKNISNVLETLGGIKGISSTFAEKNRRLELRWRPDDRFCKPTYASRRPVVALLLRVKFKKKKKQKQGTILSCQPIGHVNEEFKFCNLCDFQFLPMSNDKCIYHAVVPKGLETDWLESESPLFLPPAAFSRLDTVQNFSFNKVHAEEDKADVIGRLKRKRYGCTKIVTFDNPEVPTLPKNIPVGGVCSAKIVTSTTLEHLKKLFQERPIYSKSAIKCISKVPLVQLKCLLPCVAYYFLNGPWRSLWVRFGYDPRKDPQSRIYQTLDYRVRSHVSKDEVKNKRNSVGASVSYKFSSQSGKNVSVIKRNPTEVGEKEEKCEDTEYIFRPEIIPPSRQYFYQVMEPLIIELESLLSTPINICLNFVKFMEPMYCDVQVPEVQAMLENLDEIDDQTVCHEVDGWLPSSMANSCREIMNKYVCEEVRRRSKLANQSANQILVENQICASSGSESDSTDYDR